MFLCAFITAFHTFRRHRLCVVLLYFCCCCWFRLGFSLQRILLIAYFRGRFPTSVGRFFCFSVYLLTPKEVRMCVCLCVLVCEGMYLVVLRMRLQRIGIFFSREIKTFSNHFVFYFHFIEMCLMRTHTFYLLLFFVCFSVMIRFEIGTGISLHVVCIKYGKKFDKNVKTYAWPHSFLFWCTIFDEFLLYRKCSTPIINIS